MLSATGLPVKVAVAEFASLILYVDVCPSAVNVPYCGGEGGDRDAVSSVGEDGSTRMAKTVRLVHRMYIGCT